MANCALLEHHLQILDIIAIMKSTSCFLNAIPTKLFKDILNFSLPSIFYTFNSSLQNSIFSFCFKHAVVQHLL